MSAPNMPLMQCGCRAQGYRRLPDGSQQPACVVHAGLTPDAYIVVPEPDLSTRRARCDYYSQCHQERASSDQLAFFQHHPDRPYDGFYCGCHGWD